MLNSTELWKRLRVATLPSLLKKQVLNGLVGSTPTVSARKETMLITIEDVFKIKGRGFAVVLQIEKIPKAGDLLGTQKILAVDKFHVSCYGGKEPLEHRVGVLLKDSPTVGEQVELSYT